VRWLAGPLILLAVPAWAQSPPQARQQPPDATELDVANHWQALDLANKNLASALGRLVEDRRKVMQELEAQKELSKQPKVSEAPK
jgi:hypothetical protein